ncbi:2-amino-4-hydroxy-6-hydroxymethyldihydropteridine diphosphokinase [Candidatus Peregrinibacteria bacterium]|nr:2-amino-4-hydroxy-6-hydroxymethyldihydropteridine diphosphokinase [Candidatus Peregrinibacteria bacterium]
MRIFLSLGSNLGNRRALIKQAISELNASAGRVIKKSKIYETEPVGNKNQPMFLNCCVEIETDLPPLKLLAACQKIEKRLGRLPEEKGKMLPRTIDIDILFYGNRIINTPKLTLPHPRICEREFVLKPLAEIAFRAGTELSLSVRPKPDGFS